VYILYVTTHKHTNLINFEIFRALHLLRRSGPSLADENNYQRSILMCRISLCRLWAAKANYTAFSYFNVLWSAQTQS